MAVRVFQPGQPVILSSRRLAMPYGGPVSVWVPGGIVASFMDGSLPSSATLTRTTVGTRRNVSGTLETVAIDGARFHYSSGLALQGVLNEPAALNQIVQSTTITGTSAKFTVARSTFGANATTSPDGTGNATSVIEDTTVTNTHGIFCNANLTVSNGVAWTFSIFAKADTRTWIDIRANATALLAITRDAYFDLANGVTGSVGAGLTAAMESWGNGWWRCSISGVGNADAVNGTLLVFLATGNNGITYTGDGASKAFLYGGQFVNSTASMSSFIPSTTTAVTRGADILTVSPGANTYSITVNRASGPTIVGSTTVGAGGYAVPTDTSPVQSVVFA